MFGRRRRRRSRSRSNSPLKSPPTSPVPLESSTNQDRNHFIENFVEGFVFGTGISISKKIFDTENKPVKMDAYKEKTEININNQELWIKYNDCIEKSNKDDNKCGDLLIEKIN